MSLAPILDPANIYPQRDRILAIQYTRPKVYGSLHLPEAYDKDGTWNWWECVKAGPDVEKKLGIELRPGDLFRTPWRPAIDLGAEDARGRGLFIVPCTVQAAGRDGKMEEKLNVEAVYPNTWDQQ